MKNKFRNANEAYEYIHDRILQDGIDFADTKALFNVGFYITDSQDNKIINKERNWKQDYAEAEWQWYLAGMPNIKMLGEIYGKIPPIWKRMANEQGYVDIDIVCISGASYGGYAAIQAATKNPELFKCIIAYVGVYDLTISAVLKFGLLLSIIFPTAPPVITSPITKGEA